VPEKLAIRQFHPQRPLHILGYEYTDTGKQAIVMAGKRRRVSNPLALAVLASLRERPMHPYEMAATMRSQGKERSIKLNYGSLYTVVDNLAKHGLIEAMEASREGRRPERTVYRLTDEGRAELEDWLTELLGTPVKEYPQFEAALAEIAVLPPDQVRDVLEHRVEALEQAVAQQRAETAQLTWLPRLFLLENEYHLAIREAELAWVRGLAEQLRDGSFPLMKEKGAADLTQNASRPPARCGNTWPGADPRTDPAGTRSDRVVAAQGYSVSSSRTGSASRPAWRNTYMSTQAQDAGLARATHPRALAIEARDLVKTYPKGVRALDGLSFAVQEGTIFGLLGPNGAGKSTTVKILTTLAQADAGSASVAGLDVHAQAAAVRRAIGVVAQRSGADPTATGRENLLLSGRIQGLRGRELGRRAGELLARFDLAEAAGRMVLTYSGGLQ